MLSVSSCQTSCYCHLSITVMRLHNLYILYSVPIIYYSMLHIILETVLNCNLISLRNSYLPILWNRFLILYLRRLKCKKIHNFCLNEHITSNQLTHITFNAFFKVYFVEFYQRCVAYTVQDVGQDFRAAVPLWQKKKYVL